MAEILYLQLDDPDDALHRNHHRQQRQTRSQDIESLPYWAHPDDFDLYASDTEFSAAAAEFSVPIPLVSAGDGFDPLDRHNFVIDLFHQRVEQSQVTSLDNIGNNDLGSELGSGVIEKNCEIVVDGLELGLGLGSESRGLERNNSGFVVGNFGDSDIDVSIDVIVDDDDDFFVERRVSGFESHEAASMGCSFGNEIQVIGFGFDSDDDEGEHESLSQRDRWGIDSNGVVEYVNDDEDDDASVTILLCWDSLQLENQRETNENFEWEEIDDHVVDEREVLSVLAEADNDNDDDSISISVSPFMTLEDIAGGERANGIGNLGWEVLLNSRIFESNPEIENNLGPYSGDHNDNFNTTEYEMLFEQFAEVEILTTCRPPASKAFVENLPLVVVTKDDVENGNGLCAVCKDDMNVGCKAAQLNCTHRYHKECIVPWLGIRNTCPVCRYELPTDDA